MNNYYEWPPAYAGEKQQEVFMKYVKTVLIVLALVSVLAGCGTTSTSSSYSMKVPSSGVIRDISITAKDFEPIGLVFVEAVIENGNGEMLTYDALLKAAAARGGNGIVNVMIDVKRERHEATSSSMLGGSTSRVTIKETWYGSALAIRYTTTPAPNAPMSTDSRSLSASGSGASSSAAADSGGGLLGALGR